jgi:hypothetical protein
MFVYTVLPQDRKSLAVFVVVLFVNEEEEEGEKRNPPRGI